MPFDRDTNSTKNRIGAFEIQVKIPDPFDPDGAQSGELFAQVVLSDNSIQTRSFDLLKRLQDDAAGRQHLQNLAALRDYIRARLEAEVLPV